MSAKRRSPAPPGNAPPTIVVAGDVCVDWLSVPVEAYAPADPDMAPNWRQRDGWQMHARRGGAWLTGDLLRAALGHGADVRLPASIERLEAVPPEEVLHSLLILSPCDRDGGARTVWVLKRFEGYAGPPPDSPAEMMPVENDDPGARLLLLDDSGNGFRDAAPTLWPAALRRGKPLIFHKVRAPLRGGSLWRHLHARHRDRCVLLLDAEDLRRDGAPIARGLSWESTATDLLLAVAHRPSLTPFRACPFLVISLGIEGCVLLRCADGRVRSAHLWYVPELIEGDLLGGKRGGMSGFGSVLAAAVAAAAAPLAAHRAPDDRTLEEALHDGIGKALRAQHRLLELGFGPCTAPDPKNSALKVGRPPSCPLEAVFSDTAAPAQGICDVALPPMSRSFHGSEAERCRQWRIIDSARTKPMISIAEETLRHGVRKSLPRLPVGRFGALETLDRAEIESYRSIRSLIREFLRIPKPDRPLCLAVFGPPGSGKSFGVTQVARSVAEDGQVERIEFNVAQWNEPADLARALHSVRDLALRGKVPLVFFDEFDASRGPDRLSWLKYFLAPMQDGVFNDGSATHLVGKAVFVFAGGTAESFRQFASQTDVEPSARAAKLPDFLSRLRGHVDVFGFSPPTGTNLLRRALVLRGTILRKFPDLVDARGALRIDPQVSRAFLQVSSYRHGARSLEALLEMSRLAGRTHFDPSLLPPRQQLAIHVDADEFVSVLQHLQTLGESLEKIARAIHENYLRTLPKDAKRGIGVKPSGRRWEELDDLYRNSSREQAAHYPALLAAAGCGFVRGKPDRRFRFTAEESDRLARMEHERWLEERRIGQPDHPDLRPWAGLSAAARRKDTSAVRAIPHVLATAGLRIVRHETR